jgi:hypothetical protein
MVFEEAEGGDGKPAGVAKSIKGQSAEKPGFGDTTHGSAGAGWTCPKTSVSDQAHRRC